MHLYQAGDGLEPEARQVQNAGGGARVAILHIHILRGYQVPSLQRLHRKKHRSSVPNKLPKNATGGTTRWQKLWELKNELKKQLTVHSHNTVVALRMRKTMMGIAIHVFTRMT